MIELKKHSFIKGEVIEVHISHNELSKFDQVQLEIFDTCVLNPKSVIGFGTTPEKVDDKFHKVKFKTDSLKEGIFEIKLMRLHTPKTDLEYDENTCKDFIGGKDFNRIFFQIDSAGSAERTLNELSSIVIDEEKEIEKKFNSGIVLSTKNANPYSVFALIKGLKTGVQYRFNKFEILPLSIGLNKTDELAATNFFLKNYTSTNLLFEYTEEIAKASQQEQPITVAHFPRIESESQELAYSYVENKITHLLEVLSLTRGASGEIFDFIVINLNSLNGTRFSKRNSYIGNLLTGNLSGENPETVEKYIQAIENDEFKRFLTSLHKETLAEANLNFKILRYWSILEILAESKNYHTERYKTPLSDFDGNPLQQIDENGEVIVDEDGEPKIVKEKNAISNVYNLLRDNSFGSPYSNLGKIKTWIALRNAVAHFGDINQFENLRNSEDRIYAQKAIEKMEESPGFNPILFELKEDVKLILMRDLIQNSTAH